MIVAFRQHSRLPLDDCLCPAGGYPAPYPFGVKTVE